MTSKLASLTQWVDSVAQLTQPDAVHWCDGSDAENARLVELMLSTGDLVRLNDQCHPNCYQHRPSPSGVALTPKMATPYPAMPAIVIWESDTIPP